MIKVSNLRKQYSDNVVLRDISLLIARWEVLDLIGPYCSGKYNLLRCANLLVQPDGGEVSVSTTSFNFNHERSFPSDAQQARFRTVTGVVFQHFNLFPHMTVL